MIVKSSNVGAAKLAAKPEQPAVLRRAAAASASAQVTGSGFPGESPACCRRRTAGAGRESRPCRYGYGLTVTPLQIARLRGAWPTAACCISPTFVKGSEPGISAQVIDPKIAGQVLHMLQTVTEPGGTADAGRDPGLPRGRQDRHLAQGQRPAAIRNRYIRCSPAWCRSTTRASRWSVVIHDPTAAYYGGVVSAPVFRNVMDGALRLMDVSPDNLEQWYRRAKERAEASGRAPPD